MKKILSLAVLMLAMPVIAKEAVQQEQTVTETKATIAVQKQPTQETATQRQEIKNIWFSIIIQVQGKVPGIEKDTPTPVK